MNPFVNINISFYIYKRKSIISFYKFYSIGLTLISLNIILVFCCVISRRSGFTITTYKPGYPFINIKGKIIFIKEIPNFEIKIIKNILSDY